MTLNIKFEFNHDEMVILIGKAIRFGFTTKENIPWSNSTKKDTIEYAIRVIVSSNVGVNNV